MHASTGCGQWRRLPLGPPGNKGVPYRGHCLSSQLTGTGRFSSRNQTRETTFCWWNSRQLLTADADSTIQGSVQCVLPQLTPAPSGPGRGKRETLHCRLPRLADQQQDKKLQRSTNQAALCKYMPPFVRKRNDHYGVASVKAQTIRTRLRAR